MGDFFIKPKMGENTNQKSSVPAPPKLPIVSGWNPLEANPAWSSAPKPAKPAGEARKKREKAEYQVTVTVIYNGGETRLFSFKGNEKTPTSTTLAEARDFAAAQLWGVTCNSLAWVGKSYLLETSSGIVETKTRNQLIAELREKETEQGNPSLGERANVP